jgi:peptide/nickel transport system ATP-binding protein
MLEAFAVMPFVEVDAVSLRYAGAWPAPKSQELALDGVSLGIERGEVFGVVGESGSGKSTLARVILKLLRPLSGSVRLDGRDIASYRGSAELVFRRRMQVVFQDSLAALDPRMRIRASLKEALDLHDIGAPAMRGARIEELLGSVGLDPGLATRFPHQLSGGQRQRVAIARAISLSPDILIADEPVSALDLSVQAQILDLLSALCRDRGMTMLFISHDLGIVRRIANKVAVMRRGRIVESGPVEDVFSRPQADYTRTLLASIPRVDFDRLSLQRQCEEQHDGQPTAAAAG